MEKQDAFLNTHCMPQLTYLTILFSSCRALPNRSCSTWEHNLYDLYINIVFLYLFWTYLTTLSVLAGPDQMGGVPLENRRKKKIPAVLNETEAPHLQLLGCVTISLDINQLNTNDLKAFLLCMYIYLLLVVCFRKLNWITSNRMAKIYHK